MTEAICKACGEQLGELAEYEIVRDENDDYAVERVSAGDLDDGDRVTCDGCGSEYDVQLSNDPRFPAAVQLFNVPGEDSRSPGFVEVVEAGYDDESARFTITWLREDGVQVRSYRDEVPDEASEDAVNDAIQELVEEWREDEELEAEMEAAIDTVLSNEVTDDE